MTSQRVTEIKKVMNIQTFIQVLAFAGFWVPFFYLWSINLKPLTQSLITSIIIASGVIVIIYVPWKKSTAKMKRLRKYSILFDPFFEAMITDMEANDEEKDDTWITWDLDELVKLQNKIIRRLQSSKRSKIDEWVLQPKLANYCAMLYLRRLILV